MVKENAFSIQSSYVVKFVSVRVVCSNNNSHLINKSLKFANESQYYLYQKWKNKCLQTDRREQGWKG